MEVPWLPPGTVRSNTFGTMQGLPDFHCKSILFCRHLSFPFSCPVGSSPMKEMLTTLGDYELIDYSISGLSRNVLPESAVMGIISLII